MTFTAEYLKTFLDKPETRMVLDTTAGQFSMVKLCKKIVKVKRNFDSTKISYIKYSDITNFLTYRITPCY